MQPASAVLAIFLPVVILSVFAFTSITTWADARRREREAFYRSEAIKKVAESSGGGGAAALEFMREQERIERRRRRDGLKLGGFMTSGVGLGLMIFLRGIERDVPVYLVGLIPLFVGLAMLVHLFLLADRD